MQTNRQKIAEKKDLTNHPVDLENRIGFRAYELYELRGRVDGRALDDWLQAETEVLGRPSQRLSKSRGQ